MSDSNYAQHGPAAERAGTRPGSRVANGLRTVLLVVTVATGCYVAYGFGKLLAEWQQAGRSSPPPGATAVNLQPMAAALPLAGQWSFADFDWNLKSRDVAAGEVEKVLASLADKPTFNDGEHLPDISEELLQLAESLHVEPVDLGSNRVYRLDRGDLKALMVVRIIDGKSKAVALAAAYPQSGDRWQFIEITPRQSTVPLADMDHLLPLPRGAGRSGGRFADDGTLLLELVALESNADQLLAQWKDAGWEVRPSGLGGPDDFSYLCARGDEVIYAWSANPRDALQNLMLVRSPDEADTNSQ